MIEDFNKSRTEWEEIIEKYVFSEFDRKLLKRRLLDGLTFEKLAEEMDMSERNIRRKVHKAQEKLFKHI